MKNVGSIERHRNWFIVDVIFSNCMKKSGSGAESLDEEAGTGTGLEPLVETIEQRHTTMNARYILVCLPSYNSSKLCFKQELYIYQLPQRQ
jgi:hypothetical protein